MSTLLYVLVAVCRLVVVLPFAIVADVYAFVLSHKAVLLVPVAVLIVGCGGKQGYCPDGYSISYPDNDSYTYGMCKMYDEQGNTISVVAATAKPAWTTQEPTRPAQDYSQETNNLNHMVDKAQDAGNPIDNVSKGLNSAATAADDIAKACHESGKTDGSCAGK